MDEDNRRLLNRADEEIQPSSPTSQVALTPVMVPAGTVLLSADIAVIHPIDSMGHAVHDTGTFLWEDVGQTGSAFRGVLLLVPRVVATPVVLTGDFAVRSLFDVE
jgi:hypothetical protein